MLNKTSHKEKNKTSERALGWISCGSLRPTKQRIKLAELLIGDGKNRHITAESLFELAKKNNVCVSLATIYNTLKSFCDSGLINEIIVDGGRSYFDTRIDDHPHFFWEDTGELTDAPSNLIEIKNLPEAPNNSEITKIDVIIRLRKKMNKSSTPI